MQFAKRLLAGCALVFLAFSTIEAQQAAGSSATAVPRLISFSGRATDAKSKPISGVAGVTFSVYQDEYDGAPLWMETQNVTADGTGNFTAQLGATKPEGLPLDLFASGEARWLGVTINGGQEQPRVLLLSVPYALKAADAQTLGGLPASAFMLASPAVAVSNVDSAGANPNGASPNGSAPPPASSDVTTSGGTVNAVALFTTATNVQNSILTQTATTAINVAGKLNLPATGAATASKGFASRPMDFVASSFNSATAAPVTQTFQWQAEQANNNTANPSAVLSLLYGSGTTAPAETGLRIGPKGIIGFAPGQTFPGAGGGTITGVTAGTGLSGGGTSGTVTLNSTGLLGLTAGTGIASSGGQTPTLSVSGVPLLGTNNTFTQNNIFEPFNTDAIDAYAAWPGKSALVGVQSAHTGGSYGVWGQTLDPTGAGVSGSNYATTAGGAGVQGYSSNGGGVVGTSETGYAMVANGNATQSLNSGGWVKAMAYIDYEVYPLSSSVLRCFNSTLTGIAATTPPCNITLTVAPGQVGPFVDFGFKVDDRFLMAQPTGFYASVFACVDTDQDCSTFGKGPTSTEVLVFIDNSNGSIGNQFYLFVY